MPDAKNNAKLTGDTHPPDVEEDARAPQASDDAALASDLANESRPGKGVNQAGFLKDKDGTGGKDKA